MAVNRYQSLLRRFQHQPELERDYEAAMQKTLDQGYASRVEDPADAKYFLAHHGVYKGTKLRVVFDAAPPPIQRESPQRCHQRRSGVTASARGRYHPNPARRMCLGLRN